MTVPAHQRAAIALGMRDLIDTAVSTVPVGPILPRTLILIELMTAYNQDRGCYVQDICSQSAASPSTMWRVLQQMEEHGYVETLSSPTDRRFKIVRPTDQLISNLQPKTSPILQKVVGACQSDD